MKTDKQSARSERRLQIATNLLRGELSDVPSIGSDRVSAALAMAELLLVENESFDRELAEELDHKINLRKNHLTSGYDFDKDDDAQTPNA